MTNYILTEIPTMNILCLYKVGSRPQILTYTKSSAKWLTIPLSDYNTFLSIESIILDTDNIDSIKELLTNKYTNNEYYYTILQFLKGEQ